MKLLNAKMVDSNGVEWHVGPVGVGKNGPDPRARIQVRDRHGAVHTVWPSDIPRYLETGSPTDLETELEDLRQAARRRRRRRP